MPVTPDYSGSSATQNGLRIGPRSPARRAWILTLALLGCLLATPGVLFALATRQALPVPGGLILGPRFRGRVPFPSGATLEVSHTETSPELVIMRPAPPGRRYRWMVEEAVGYSELNRDYGGCVEFLNGAGKRSVQVSQLWLGFVRVER